MHMLHTKGRSVKALSECVFTIALIIPQVYDVSSFTSRHPGGVEQILAGAGRDITQVFKSYHKVDTFQRYCTYYRMNLLYTS